jgi:hypothetical protein
MTDIQHRPRAEGDPDRPLLTMVHVEMRDPGPHGMGTAAESSRLDTAFDAVVDGLPPLRSLYVARSRDSGFMNFVLYSPAASGADLEGLIARVLRGESIDIEHREDPTWTVFRQLLPSLEEERELLDIRVIQVLQEHGDPLTPKRDVHHRMYFEDHGAAKSLGDELKREGFSVEITSEPGYSRPIVLLASRDDAVTRDAITPITIDLLRRAHACGGFYDGWEARLLKPKPGLLGKLFGKKQ